MISSQNERMNRTGCLQAVQSGDSYSDKTMLVSDSSNKPKELASFRKKKSKTANK